MADGSGLSYPASSISTMPFSELKLYARWATPTISGGVPQNRYRPVVPIVPPVLTGNQVLVDQVPTPSTTINSNSSGTQVVTSAQVSAEVQTLSPLRALKDNKRGFIQIAPAEYMTISGSGYQPDSLVDIYLISGLKKLVSAKTNSFGSFSAKLQLPKNTSLGFQTLQFGGNLASGEVAIFNTGIYVAANPDLRVSFTPNSAYVSKQEAAKLAKNISKVIVGANTKISVTAYSFGSPYSYRAKQIATARASAIATAIRKLYPTAKISATTKIQNKISATAYSAEVQFK